MKIFDTRLKKKVELKPMDGKCIRMYTCGPTVYNVAHIGNLRAFIFEDVLRRAIRFCGMDVIQVMNITDVDDKTIRGAKEAGLPLDEFTKKYKEAFFEDLDQLAVERADHYPEATKHVKEMIDLIQTLIDKNVAYVTDTGDVFFRIKEFPTYGSLTHLDMDNLKVGASNRVGSDEYDKESVSDFALWKRHDEKNEGAVFWESPWGKGRPGWHIECSAMAMKYLGESFDLHTGAVDNCFPHHENEIAQSEAATGKTFVKHWAHAEHLIVDGKKMSKSLGNFYTLRDLIEKGYSGREVRYVYVTSHYRQKLNFTFESLDGAKSALNRIDSFVSRLSDVERDDGDDCKALVEKATTGFSEHIADDLNTSAAFSTIFDLIREVNAKCDQNSISKQGAESILKCLDHFDTVLGVLKAPEVSIPIELIEALEARNEARKNKNWAVADEMRDKIATAGYVIEDGASGSKLKKK